MAVMEVILKAIDQVSPVMDKVQGATGKATGFMEKNWLKVGAAATALAGGIEIMYKKQAPLIESSRKLASSLDMTEGAVRNMAIEISNVTFPLESVFNIMETGRQQGIKSAEQLKDYAAFWDKVGDATGENADSLAEASSALRAVGVAAGEEGEKLDKAFGYIVKETTGSVGEFLTFLSKCGPELREMGMAVDDSAAILGALERELGMTAMVARTEFRQAVNEADGDVNKLYKTLGLTEEQVKKYSDQLEDSGGVINEFARINNETMYTSLDKLKHAFSELTLKFSPVLEGLAKFAPILMVVGPAMKVVSMASKGMTQALGLVSSGFTIAMSAAKSFIGLAMANPLTPWIIAIGAVVTAIVLLYKNWDKVTAFMSKTLDWIKDKFGILLKPIGAIIQKVKDFGMQFEWVRDIVEKVTNFIGEKLDWIADKFDWLSNSVNWVKEKLGLVKEESEKVTDAMTGTGEAIDDTKESTDKAKDSFDNETEAMDETTEAAEDLGEAHDDLADSIGKTKEETEKAIETFEEYCQRMDEERQALEEEREAEQERLKKGLEEELTAMEKLEQEVGITLNDLTESRIRALEEERDALIAITEQREEDKELVKQYTAEIIAEYNKRISKLSEVKNKLESVNEAEGKAKSRPIYYIKDKEGNVLGATNMPQDYANKEGIVLEKMHSGGVFRAPQPGGEGLALLKDKEIVSTPAQAGGMNISISPGAIQINTQKLDDREINRVGDKLMDIIISKSRAYNLRFAR